MEIEVFDDAETVAQKAAALIAADAHAAVAHRGRLKHGRSVDTTMGFAV